MHSFKKCKKQTSILKIVDFNSTLYYIIAFTYIKINIEL